MAESEQQPFERLNITSLKDHELRELVNELTKVARVFTNAQQLRSRICGVVLAAIKPYRDEALRSGDVKHIPPYEKLLEEDDPILRCVHFEVKENMLSESDIDSIAYSSEGHGLAETMDLIDKIKAATTNGEILASIARFRKETRVQAIKSALLKLK
jgi:hypothetical protein